MTKRSHYETLGVKPDASPSEIKRTFRQKAASAHPDKGGDHVGMAELNHAYEVLIDPKRRLLYDATGESDQRPEAEMIRGMLTQVFADGLSKDVPHILNHAKEMLKQGKQALEQQTNEITKQRDRLKAKRDKITKKRGENVFSMIVDQQIVKFDQQLAQIELDLDILVKAQKELANYKSSEEVPTYTMSDVRFSQQWTAFGNSST